MTPHEPSLFDIDPDAAPQGEPSSQPAAPVVHRPVNLPTRVSAGVVADESGGASCAKGDGENPSRLPLREVPADIFLSWPEKQQLEYCAKRDEDSALDALDDEWAAFYRQRAQDYRLQASVAL